MTTAGINSTPTEVAAPAPTAQITNNEISFVLKASPAAPEKQAASVLSTQNRIEQKYKFAKITPYSYSPEDFFFTDSYSILLSQIRKIMESEAPISKSLLCKKILSEWGISRLGTRVEAQIETALDTLNIYRTEYEGLVFCWNDKEQCASYSIYRPVSDREATDIPPEEIANAIRQLLTDFHQPACGRFDKSMRTTVRLCPYGIEHRRCHAKRYSRSCEKELRQDRK